MIGGIGGEGNTVVLMGHDSTVAAPSTAHQTVSADDLARDTRARAADDHVTDDLVPDGEGNHRAPAPDCPVEVALAAVAGKWTTLILRDLSRNDLSYTDIRNGLPQLSDKVLSDRLDSLVARGLVARTRTATVPPRTAYALTEAGRALRPLLVELHATGTRLRRLTAETATEH